MTVDKRTVSQNIRRFYISVNNILLVQITQRIQHLLSNRRSFLLREVHPNTSNLRLQITPAHHLLYNIELLLVLAHLNGTYHVWMMHHLTKTAVKVSLC